MARERASAGPEISLFPFLSILACLIGALTILIVALSVSEGQAGLDEFTSKAMFEDSRQMKSLYSKVLLKIKKVTILED